MPAVEESYHGVGSFFHGGVCFSHGIHFCLLQNPLRAGRQPVACCGRRRALFACRLCTMPWREHGGLKSGAPARHTVPTALR